MNKAEQKQVLERFLEFHDIEVPVFARMSHIGRRFRTYFPDITEPLNPYPGSWSKKKVAELAEFVRPLDPASFTKKPDFSHFQKKPPKPVNRTREFLRSWEWREIRFEVLRQRGQVCQCCGAKAGEETAAGDRVRIEVDHIKPISKNWHLRLVLSNLQVLCRDCNKGKGNRHSDRF